MKKSKGFTLIEMIVTVVIIGILASVALGFLSGQDSTYYPTSYQEKVIELDGTEYQCTPTGR